MIESRQFCACYIQGETEFWINGLPLSPLSDLQWTDCTSLSFIFLPQMEHESQSSAYSQALLTWLSSHRTRHFGQSKEGSYTPRLVWGPYIRDNPCPSLAPICNNSLLIFSLAVGSRDILMGCVNSIPFDNSWRFPAPELDSNTKIDTTLSKRLPQVASIFLIDHGCTSP
jgi:hypothetical protein